MATFLAADDAHLHYDELTTTTAAGPPMVVLAGGAARHPEYLSDLAGLAENHPLVVPHLRGVGESPAPAEPEAGSYWRQADDVEALRRHLGADRLVLAGHSAGTRLAAAYAAQYPERVDALLMITPPAGYLVDVASDTAVIIDRRDGEPAFTAAVAALEAGPAGLTDEVFHAWQRLTAPAGYATWGPAEQDHARVGRWYPAAVRGYFSVTPPGDFAGRLGAVTAPVLVVAGAEDVLTGVAPVRALSGLFPDGRFVLLDGCGHYPWVERPAAFRRTVDAFLDEVVDPHLPARPDGR